MRPEKHRRFKIKEDSSSVLWVLFNNNSKPQLFYSLDWKHSSSKNKNAELGVTRLLKFIHRNKRVIERARIYTNDSKNRLLYEYVNGQLQINDKPRP